METTEEITNGRIWPHRQRQNPKQGQHRFLLAHDNTLDVVGTDREVMAEAIEQGEKSESINSGEGDCRRGGHWLNRPGDGGGVDEAK
jgi:hypothetical protein